MKAEIGKYHYLVP